MHCVAGGEQAAQPPQWLKSLRVSMHFEAQSSKGASHPQAPVPASPGMQGPYKQMLPQAPQS